MHEVKRRLSKVMTRDAAPQPAPDFERLVEQYQTAVLRTCCLYLCDWSQTKDAVQEMEPDAGKLETGTVLTYICQCENLQTGERENGTITVGLPAMTMQEGHQEEE